MSAAVDSLLSETADFLQAKIDADPALHTELSVLFNQDARPSVVRILNGFVGASAVIMLGRPE